MARTRRLVVAGELDLEKLRSVWLTVPESLLKCKKYAPGGLLRTMNTELHDLSQPMTALLCLLEYGTSLEASDELKQVMTWSAEAAERLRMTVTAMQRTVQKEAERYIHEPNTDVSRREREHG